MELWQVRQFRESMITPDVPDMVASRMIISNQAGVLWNENRMVIIVKPVIQAMMHLILIIIPGRVVLEEVL